MEMIRPCLVWGGDLNKDVKKAYDESVKVEDLAPKEPEIKTCETCGQEVCEHKND